jgi:hypothetical protein
MGTSSSYSAEVKNGWYYTFPHPTCLRGVDRDVFTFCTLCKNGLVISAFFYQVADNFSSNSKVKEILIL